MLPSTFPLSLHREKALTIYIFSRSAKTQQAFLEETSCGSVCVNDTMMQFTGEILLVMIFRVPLHSTVVDLLLLPIYSIRLDSPNESILLCNFLATN